MSSQWERMKILQNKNKTTFVMSDNGDKCPRIYFACGSAKIRDDYKGSLKFKSKIIAKLV